MTKNPAPEASPEVKALKADVTDLLNQILIKLKDVKSYDSEYNDDGYGASKVWNKWNDDNEGKLPNDEVFLSCIKSYIELAVKGDGETLERVEQKYYSSACW